MGIIEVGAFEVGLWRAVIVAAPCDRCLQTCIAIDATNIDLSGVIGEICKQKFMGMRVLLILPWE